MAVWGRTGRPVVCLALAALCFGSGGAQIGATGVPDSSAPAEESAAPSAPTDEPLVVGIVTDETVGGGDTTGYADGVDLWADDVNERGGVFGRPVEVKRCYTEQDPARATECTEELIADPEVMAFVGGASIFWPSAIAPSVVRAGMLQMPAAGYSFADSALENCFQVNVGTYGVTGVLPRWVAETTGATKFAVIRLDIGATADYGDGVRAVLEPLGAEVVAEVAVPATTTDFLPAVLQAVQSGAEYIVPALGPAQVVSLLDAINDGGYGADIGLTLVAGQAGDEAIVAAQGDVDIATFRENTLLVEGDAAAAEFAALAEQFNPEKFASDPGRLAQSYITARAFEELVLANGEEISRESLAATAMTAEIQVPGIASPLTLVGAPEEFRAVAITSVDVLVNGEVAEAGVAVFPG